MRVQRRTATITVLAVGLAAGGSLSAVADPSDGTTPEQAQKVSAPRLAARPSSATVAAGAKDAKPASTKKFRQAVKTENIEAHLRALQEIADENGGNRAAGTPGYEQSGRYIEAVLRKAGYRTKRQFFDFTYEQTKSDTLAVTSPARTIAHKSMSYSPATPKGGLTAALVAPKNPLGCTADDWAGVAATGKIALVQRGTCSFSVKSKAAKAAGASAALIYNNAEGALNGTLGEISPDHVPTAGLEQAEGATLLDAMAKGPVTVSFDLVKTLEKRRTFNILAETKQGDPNNVVMLGSHLDSVADGPGINDNGSGSATDLEVAVQLAGEKKLKNKVRFAWWSAEELGLLGSEHYVDDMKKNSPDDLKKIATYLNFDMVGSPNYIVGVYDADQSTYEAPVDVPKGSSETEAVFEDYFDSQKQPWIDTEFSGRSDYQAFIENGIPASGLFSGADDKKTKGEVMLFGGTAGITHDPNYHTPKDNLANVDRHVLDIMSDAIAHTTLTLARSTKAINGK